MAIYIMERVEQLRSYIEVAVVLDLEVKKRKVVDGSKGFSL